MPLRNIIKIFQTIKKSLSAQKFGLEIYSVSRECTRKRTKQELSFLQVTYLLDLIYVLPKYNQIISDSMGLEICSGEITRKKNKVRVVLLAFNTPT